MTIYKNITDMITEEYNQSRADMLRHIENDENILKKNLTPARLKRYEEGKITRDEAVKLAFNRARKLWDNYEDEKLKEIKEAAEAPEVVCVSISVEWHRSRLWGYNPAAEVIIVDSDGHYSKYFGSASGCGYDKESSAVAKALNQSAPIKKMLCDKKEKSIREGKTYGANSTMNKNYISYDAGYGSVPYFEGGVGMGSHKRIFEACGLKLKNSNHGKHFDTYYFEREEV